MTVCTCCNSGKLLPVKLDANLTAKQCNHCHGHWILIEDYVAWKQRQARQGATELPIDAQYSLAEDNSKALLCPVSGSLMRKFRLKADTRRRLDYSPAIGAIWLDAGEWEYIKQSGLANSLNAIVTDHYQQQVRRDSSKQQFAEIYAKKFGDEPYGKIREFRAWLEQQPNQADLKAYLMATDPYRG